jgi:hypothetical protein
MQHIALILVSVALLAGCANSPKPPAAVSGPYRPINTPDFRPPSQLIPKVFDFKYRGDPERAIDALREVQPQLTILPASGDKQRQGLVNVDLRQVTLEKALFEIGKQGGGIYEVIYKPDTANNRDFAFIKYIK